MWSKHLSLLVIAFGIFGYLLSMAIADGSWLSAPPVLYEFILMLKTVFLAALKMLITPLVFFSLLAGMLQISQVAQIGRLGQYTLIYYLSTTVVAILIGLVVVFFIHPWKSYPNVTETQNGQLEIQAPAVQIEKQDSSLVAVLTKMLKRVFVNPFNAFAENNLLGVVFWSFLLGLSFIIVNPAGSQLPDFFNHFNLLINKILSWVILFSPIGVFAIAFDFQIKFSNEIVSQLVTFCLVVFGATAVHALIVLPFIAKTWGGVKFTDFFKKAAKPMLLAFSTSSSSATLPVTMQTAENEFAVKKSISGFVLPLGATMNMDGTALFEGVAAVFIAYLFGIELSTIATVSIFLMAMISSIGAPGMPSGSMSGMQMVLIAAGIPLEGIGVLMMVERLLDTFRTAVNVQGDLVGALVVNKKMQT